MNRVELNSAQTVKFPSEEEINAYIQTHPLKKTGTDTALYVPKVFQTLAAFFANKEIPKDQIEAHVSQMMGIAIEKHGSEDQVKLHKLHRDVKGLVAKWEEAKIDAFSLKSDVLASTTPPLLDATIKVCNHLVKDILDKATFLPPEQGQDSWTRVVKKG